MALPATDNFTRADASTLGANWTEDLNILRIVSNVCAGASGGSNEGYAYWNADSFTNDQYSQCTATLSGGTYGYGPMVRLTIVAGVRLCYWAFIDSASTVTIYRMSGFSAVGAQFTGLTVSNGDLWRLSIVGTTLTLSQNGVSLGTRTDVIITAGSPGVGIYAERGTLGSWQGDNAGAGATRGLFMSPGISGVGIGGSFFRDPLQGRSV